MNADVPGFAGHIGPEPAAAAPMRPAEKKPVADSIAGFAGYVGAPTPGKPAGGGKALVSFLDKNLKKEVHLDITLSDDQAEGLTENAFQADDGKTLYTFSVLNNWKQWREGGTEIAIHVPPGETLAFDAGAERRLTGTFQVADFVGPHQGFFSFVLKPVN